MRELVDGPCHEAWQQAAGCLLPPAVASRAWQTGAAWQAAIRHEWKAQQNLRSATIQQVAKVHSVKAVSSFWADSTACPRSSNIFVSLDSAGALWMMNASLPGAVPIRVHSRVGIMFCAFLGRDSQLRIADPQVPKDGRFNLSWYVIDTASGRIIKRHKTAGLSLFMEPRKTLYHAPSHQVVCTPDEGSAVIMDAESLQETTRLALFARCDPDHRVEMRSMGWSARGSMVAVLLGAKADPDSQGHITRAIWGWSEAQVYDTATGSCLQTLQLNGRWGHCSWSSSLDLVVVVVEWERTHAPSAEEQVSDEEDAVHVTTTIRVMDPIRETAEQVPQEAAFRFGPGWSGCAWSPCGRLLAAAFLCELDEFLGPSGPERGTCLLDPHSFQEVYTTFQGSGQMHWIRAPPGRQPGACTIYMPGLDKLVTFINAADGWQVEAPSVWRADGAAIVGISPDGGTHVLILGRSQNQSHCHSLCHHDLHTSQTVCITRRLSHPSASSNSEETYFAGCIPLRPVWIPLPTGWRSMYAYLHVVSPHATNVVLVDTGVHRIVGAWSAPALARQAAGRASRIKHQSEIIESLKCSPDGRCLAVRCNTYAWIAAF